MSRARRKAARRLRDSPPAVREGAGERKQAGKRK